jgi:hypothetical protein
MIQKKYFSKFYIETIASFLLLIIFLSPVKAQDGPSCTTFLNRTTTSGLGSSNIYAVFVSGNNVYAATGSGLSTSTDGGLTFSNKTTASGLGSNTVASVFASGTHVYAGTANGLSISTDGGATFTNKTFANSGLVGTTVYRVYPTSSSTIYAATSGGVNISTNGGTTFTAKTTTSGLGSNTVYGLYVSGNDIYAATQAGLSISTDGGTSFTNKTTTNGLGNNAVQGVYVVGSTVYAATSGGLSISTDGGATFTNKTTVNGLGNNSVLGVYALGNTVYAATSGGLGISTDGGATFTNRNRVNNGLGSNTVRNVYATDSKIYAATAVGLSYCSPPPCTALTLGGTIATAQSGLSPFDPVAFTSSEAASGGSGTIEYKWQSSITSSSTGFADIASSNAATYDAGALTQTTWFKRLARVNCSADWTGAVESNVLTVTVTDCINPTSGGTIAAAQSGTNTFNHAAFTSSVAASGETGTMEYKWQSSITSSSTGFADIASSDAATYDAGALTQTTWFKRLARVTCSADWTGAAASNVLEVTFNAVLPVNLSSFTAKPTPDNKVSLAWVTLTEQVNKGFRIERQTGSMAGKYDQIGFVGSKAKYGNSQRSLTYSFIDVAPIVGAASFYRLVQEDLDGKLTYSEVRMVKLNGQSVTMVFPNPSNGVVNIYRTLDGKKMNIQVTDQSGKIIINVKNITDVNYKINLLNSGVYNIKMIYPETGEESTQRIVVQK